MEACVLTKPMKNYTGPTKKKTSLECPLPNTASLDSYHSHTPHQVQFLLPSRPKMQALCTKHNLIPISNSRPSVLLKDTASRSPSCTATHQA
jgi:hypothetical protein